MRLGRVALIKIGLFFYSDHFMYKLNTRMMLLGRMAVNIMPRDKESDFFQADMETMKLSHISNLLFKSNKAMTKLLNH